MTKKDIVVGRKYKNKLCRGAIYLGVGQPPSDYQDKSTIPYKNKNLVIIDDPFQHLIGHIVVVRPDNKEFWNNFEIIPMAIG